MKSPNKNQPGEKDLKKEIEERIKEYDSAIEYFKSNEYKEDQIKKALDDKKILEESLEKINKGEKIDEKIIPKEISKKAIRYCHFRIFSPKIIAPKTHANNGSANLIINIFERLLFLKT